MFVKLPGQKQGTIDPTFTTTMDVLPTVVKQLGIRNDWKFDGKPVDEPRDVEMLRQRNGRTAKLVGLEPGRFTAQRDRYLARQLELFPSGNASIWRPGPRTDLLGDDVGALSADAASGAGGRIDNASLYRRVRPGSGVIPPRRSGPWSTPRSPSTATTP